jgi:serine/threonine protein phosphatase PrpC
VEWDIAAVTDIGQRRQNNEDAFAVRQDLGCFLVADGMGGHAAGEVASRLATETVVDQLEAAGLPLREPEPTRRALIAAVRQANRAILDEAGRNSDLHGMGTTLTALALLAGGHRACLAHVGDSRAYRLRNGRLTQLTADHTWVREQVQLGRLTPAEARTHEAASVLTRALGTYPEPDPDVTATDILTGDTLLLCSDGLTTVLDDGAIAAILAQPAPTATLAAQLVAAANLAGGPDNITVIVLRPAARP